MNKNTSLFIPFVFPNFDKKYVAEAFANVGNVDHIDFVLKQDRDGKTYNSVYVHFNNWYQTNIAFKIQDDIKRNGKCKFYHDNSEYYWIVLPNTAKKHIPGERKQRINIGENMSISLKNVDLNEPNSEEIEMDDDMITEIESEMLKIEAEMDDIEAELEAEDKHLVSIDYRYIQSVEQENAWLHGEMAQLRAALIHLDQMYKAEQAKVRAFVETSVDL